MNRKDRFVLWTSLGAISRDLSRGTKDAELVCTQAQKIHPSAIPPNAMNASRVYLRHLDGGRFFKWMGAIQEGPEVLLPGKVTVKDVRILTPKDARV